MNLSLGSRDSHLPEKVLGAGGGFCRGGDLGQSTGQAKAQDDLTKKVHRRAFAQFFPGGKRGLTGSPGRVRKLGLSGFLLPRFYNLVTDKSGPSAKVLPIVPRSPR
jgi:hypothetical protein